VSLFQFCVSQDERLLSQWFLRGLWSVLLFIAESKCSEFMGECKKRAVGSHEGPDEDANRAFREAELPVTRREDSKGGSVSQAHLGFVLRDILVVSILILAPQKVVAQVCEGATATHLQALLALSATTLFASTVGFTICGCLAPGNRWSHLGWVAIGAWMVSFCNILLFRGTLTQWLGSAPIMSIGMSVGGVLSLVFNAGEDDDDSHGNAPTQEKLK